MEFFPFFKRPYYYTNPMESRYSQNFYQNRNKSFYERNIKQDKEYDKIPYENKKEETNRNISSQKGIRFSSDDILIIVLLIFLYNEGVRDNMLFIVLILLLLT